MVSPCPPSTKAVTSSTDTPNSCARNRRKRELSSMPAMPTTRLAGSPDFCCIPDHRVQRVGDADDEGVRAMGLDAFRDLRDYAGVLADQVIARHAGRARKAG